MPNHNEREMRRDPAYREQLRQARDRLFTMFPALDPARREQPALQYPLPGCDADDPRICGMIGDCINQCYEKDGE